MATINPIRAQAVGVSGSQTDGRGGGEHDEDRCGADGRGEAQSGEAAAGDDPTGRPWLATGAFAVLVLASSVVPVPGSAPTDGADAGMVPTWIGLTDPFHLVGYAVLTVLASRGLGRGRRGLLLAAGAAVAFGFGIELVQAPIPWRSFAWRDAAVNAVGAGIGLIAVAAGDALRGRSAERR